MHTTESAPLIYRGDTKLGNNQFGNVNLGNIDVGNKN